MMAIPFYFPPEIKPPHEGHSITISHGYPNLAAQDSHNDGKATITIAPQSPHEALHHPTPPSPNASLVLPQHTPPCLWYANLKCRSRHTIRIPGSIQIRPNLDPPAAIKL
jgi:hypothetical protein